MALIIAVLSGGLAVAALALWFALILIPVAFGAGLIAYLSYRLGWRSPHGALPARADFSVGRWRSGPPRG